MSIPPVDLRGRSKDDEPYYLQDLNNDTLWSAICENEDVSVLEDMVARLKRELGDIDEERVLRRAEWSEYSAVDHETMAYRRATAEFDRWKADTFVLSRQIAKRKSELIAAMRDKIGQGGGSTARTIITRLVKGIEKMREDPDSPEEDLFELLETTWFVAQGRKWNLREFSDAGFPW